MTAPGTGDWSSSGDPARPRFRPEWSSEPMAGALAWEGPPPAAPDVERLYVRRLGPYPVRYEVPYPGDLDRVSTCFRPVLAIPLLVLVALGLLFVLAGMAIGWAAVFARRSYPSWLFSAVSGGFAWLARAGAYCTLLTDRWPSFEPHDSTVVLHYEDPPPVLSRWRVLAWKAVVLLPHIAVLVLLTAVLVLLTIAAWVWVVITGRYPRGMFDAVTGIQRWFFRVAGYFASFTDRFPPYSTAAAAGPATYASTALSGILGLLLAGMFVGGAITVAVQARGPAAVQVDYANLLMGRTLRPTTFFTGPAPAPSFAVTLRSAREDDQRYARLLNVSAAERVVVFNLYFTNRTGHDVRAGPGVLALTYNAAGKSATVAPVLLFIDGEVAPRDLRHEALTSVTGVFVIPANAVPQKLRVDPPWPAVTGGAYVFQ